jgi:hypothetical protein
MPGFTARSSLIRVAKSYGIEGSIGGYDGLIHPANVCDRSCINNCRNACIDPAECMDLSLDKRKSCLSVSANCRLQCFKACCH